MNGYEKMLFAPDGAEGTPAEGTPAVETGAPGSDSFVAPDDGAIYSEKGSLKLVTDESGRAKVELNMPKEMQETPPEEIQEEPKTEPKAEKEPEQEVAGLIGEQYQEPLKYTEQELALAMQFGQVDETRIPPAYLAQYNAYKQRDQPKEEPAQQQSPNDYYTRIAQAAEEMAKKELGMTAEEIEAAEYSDDAELANKLKVYKVAVEANRGRILADVQAEMQRRAAQANEYRAAADAVKAFYAQEVKTEKHFAEIDKRMAQRIEELPYKEAVKIVPLLEKLKKGQITRAELPVLEQYYKDTRLAFYAEKNGAGHMPKRVPQVEKPGDGTDVVRKFDPEDLSKMTRQERLYALAQSFPNN